jgi:hypothetical protein
VSDTRARRDRELPANPGEKTVPRPHPETPTGEQLEDVVARYRRVSEEHRRAGPESSRRRRLEHELQELTGRFEHLLAAPAAGGAGRRPEPPIEIVTRGPVGRRARQRLRHELLRLAETAPRPVLLARGTLAFDENPSLRRPAHASATIDLGGRFVHAGADAAGTGEAVDRLVARLGRSLHELGRRQNGRRREPAYAEPGRRRHGNLPPAGGGP